jgi:mRNA-degrading endonuclease YafQ of YafQ-DinJ toxin-antitoxin module
MKITSIKISSQYKKSFRKFPFRIGEKAIFKIKVFKENSFDPRLKTHSLSGKEKECWAFWVDYHYRIKFIFLSDEEVLFLDIGTHEIYR